MIKFRFKNEEGTVEEVVGTSAEVVTNFAYLENPERLKIKLGEAVLKEVSIRDVISMVDDSFTGEYTPDLHTPEGEEKS